MSVPGHVMIYRNLRLPLNSLFDFFLPIPSLSTTSSAHRTLALLDSSVCVEAVSDVGVATPRRCSLAVGSCCLSSTTTRATVPEETG